jgi:hypothetical protein
MALVVKDRVRVSSTTAGTGALTLGVAITGFQDFSVIGNGNTTYYTIVDPTTGDWEVGLGTYSSTGPTLTRNTVLESSNSGSAVNFLSNPKDVFVTYPAERSVYVEGTSIVPAETARLEFGNLAQGSALSVIGVTGNATANVASIAAASDHQVLRRNGTGLAFGAVALNQTNAVTGTLPVARGGTGVTTSTGTGSVVLSTSPALVTPALGTPASGNLANCTFPTLNQNTTGNAATATALQTARTIGGVSFDGTANINLPGVNIAGNQNTTGTAANVTGTVAIANGGTGGTTAQAARNNIAGVVTSGQYLRGDGTNVLMSAIQAGDVPTLNQNTTGNAATATTLQTARTINGVSFNGSANITITANTPNSATFNNGGAGAASGATFNGGSAVTISYNTVGAPSTTGTNASGTWGISITGNAATATTATTATNATTATTLQTARTINGTSFDGSANITTANWGTARTLWGQSVNGSANITAPLLPAAGSATAPAFSTSGDTNTGIFFPAADTIAVTEGGVEVIRVTSTANVGVGTTTPGEKLDVNGSIRGEQLIAANGIVVNGATVDANYTIPTGSNAMSVGPLTVDAVVTVDPGSVWLIL